MITGRLREFRPSFAIVRTWNQKCTGNHAKGKVSARIKDNSFFPYKIVTSIKTSLLSETWNFAPITSALLGKNWALPTTQNRIVILGNSSGTSGCSQHLQSFFGQAFSSAIRYRSLKFILSRFYLGCHFRLMCGVDHCPTDNYYFRSFQLAKRHVWFFSGHQLLCQVFFWSFQVIGHISQGQLRSFLVFVSTVLK